MLSPEDVVEKRFNPTRVREGYAQDEVDDFLDEVVAELRRLNAENAELRGQLHQCQARVSELNRAEVPVEAPVAAAQVVPAEVVLEKEPEPEPEPVVQVTAPAPQPVVAQAPLDPAEKAAGVIALAQRLHDEYVREGETRRDALIGEAQEQARRTVVDAEGQRDRTLSELQGRKQELEVVIDQLHDRETSYRVQLESFISTQLADLRRIARVVPDDAVNR